MDICPFDRLVELKTKFPRAKFERDNTMLSGGDEFCWYKITGERIPGTIYVLFADIRTLARKDLAKLKNNPDSNKEKILHELINKSDDEILAVSRWVQWVPDNAVPLKYFIDKYGNPHKTGTGPTLKTYYEWNQGVKVLTICETEVIRVYYTASDVEMELYHALFLTRDHKM